MCWTLLYDCVSCSQTTLTWNDNGKLLLNHQLVSCQGICVDSDPFKSHVCQWPEGRDIDLSSRGNAQEGREGENEKGIRPTIIQNCTILHQQQCTNLFFFPTGTRSIASRTSKPSKTCGGRIVTKKRGTIERSITCPKIVYLLFRWGCVEYEIKNWEPFVSGPLFAMDTTPRRSCEIFRIVVAMLSTY